MRYMEIDFQPMDVTIWVKDDELAKCWVRSYCPYRGGKFTTGTMVLDYAFEVAKLYGVSYIRVLERVGGYAYEYMKSHTARRGGLRIETYLYFDLPFSSSLAK